MSKIKQKKMLQTYLDKMRSSYLMALLFGLLINVNLLAQGETISGTVTDEGGTPLPGANVLQRGTSNGVVTDFDGNYSITLTTDGDKALIFSFVGFVSKQVEIRTDRTVNISLQEDSAVLDEVVVVGYGTVSRKNLLGSVASIKSDEISQVTPVNAFEGVQGRLSGVQIVSNNGPGATFEVQIRGTSTFGSGTSPLFVVDGQQLDNIDNLDPSLIESLEVLKDGASAAIYGSKAANGVVIITTKSGKVGKTALNVNYASTFSFIRSTVPVANTRQRVFYENARNNNLENTGRIADSLSLLFQNSFDLQDKLSRLGTRNQLNVSLSGGNEKARYFWDNGFLDQQGVIVNSGYRRANTSFRLDVNATDNLRAGTRIYLSSEEQSGLNEGQVFQQIVERIPYFPIFEPNGDFTPEIAGRQNPVAEAFARKITDRSIRTQIQNYLEWDIFPSLNFRSTLGINGRYRTRREFEPTITQRVGNPPLARERQQLTYDFLQENILTWRKKFKDHNLQIIAGSTVQKYVIERSEIRGALNNDYIPTFNNLDLEQLRTLLTEEERHNLVGLFGDISYDYKGRYLIGGTLRRDGSSRFGANTKYGVFPAYKIGWRISDEPFILESNISNILSNLKVSYTFGTTGNERIANYESLNLLRPGFIYNGSNGIAPFQLGNGDLSWESTSESNFNVSLGLFNGRFNADVAFWRKETTDLLQNVNLPPETGFGSVRQNIGAVENTGIDIAVSGTPLKTSNFEWFSSFNINFQDNEVLRLNDGQTIFDVPGNNRVTYIIEEGKPLGNFYGFRNLGVFQYDESNAFSDDGQQLTPVLGSDNLPIPDQYTLNGQPYTGEVNQLRVGNTLLRGGDIIWEDLNGDFRITGDQDRQVIGNGLTEFYGGFFNEFKYKQFSASVLIDYNFGNDIFRLYDQLRNDLNSSNETPSPDRIEGAWQRPGDIAQFARLNRVSQNRLINSQYVSKGDYIRIRNVRFNYKFSPQAIDQLKVVQSLNIYLTINNLFTFTNYEGYNPELGRRGNALRPGEDQLRYPNNTDLILGINLSL